MQGVADLLRSEEGADLHLSCGGRSVFCHSLVLRLRCPKLLHTLDREDAPRDSSGRRMLTLPSILAPGPFGTVLAFIYTDTLSDGFEDDQLAPIIAACERYELPRLQEFCELRLRDGLSPERAAAVVGLAQKAGAARLLGAAEAYLAEELDACIAAGAFAALPPAQCARVLALRFAAPLVPTVRRAGLGDAVLEAVLGLAGQDARLCDLPQPRRGDPAQGALDGCGCSALEAALWCNAAQAPRWGVAELLLARGASPKLSGLLPRVAPRVESAALIAPQLTALASRGGLSRRLAALRTRDEPLRRSAARGPVAGCGAAVRPGRGRRLCGPHHAGHGAARRAHAHARGACRGGVRQRRALARRARR